MRYLCCRRPANYHAPSYVHIRVVVDQLGAGIGAGGAGQARVERDTVILVVPCVVNDVQLVSRVEKPHWASVIAEVASIALVHLPLVTSGHAPQSHVDQSTETKAGYEQRVDQLRIQALRILLECWILDHHRLQAPAVPVALGPQDGTAVLGEHEWLIRAEGHLDDHINRIVDVRRAAHEGQRVRLSAVQLQGCTLAFIS